MTKIRLSTANMSHTTTMLNGHIDPKYLPISTKIQPPATATLQTITKYVPETNMSLKCYKYVTYTNYFMCKHETTVSIYVTLLGDTEWIGGLTKVVIYPACANLH